MSEQHPEEESFKEKVLKALNNPDPQPSAASSKQIKEPEKKVSPRGEQSVGSRRSGQATPSSKGKTATTAKEKSPKKKETLTARRTLNPEKKVANSSKKTKQPTNKKNVATKEPQKKATAKKNTQPASKKGTTATKEVKPLSGKKQEEYMRKYSREKENRVVNKIVTIVVITLLFVGGILGFSVYRYISSGLQPLDKKQTEKVAIEIPSGSSNKTIGEILEKENVIKSGMVFNYYTKFNNLTGFQAGKYNFSPNMTLDEISKELQGGTGTGSADLKVTVPEGYTVDQIAEAVEKSLKLKKEDFMDLMKDEEFFKELAEKYPELLKDAAAAKDVRYRLEGYLFPATYDYYQGTDLKSLVTQMVDKTNSVMSQYYQTIQEKQLNVQEVMTLASLVEKEGNNENDRRKIAQVFFNRLARDMPLQSDITILYALGEHKELVTVKDTQVDSPYNLYVNLGYGPGPFNNPSEQSIKAVLNPQTNNYYYFVADITTGQVYYAETYEEHMALVEKYVNNRESN